MVVLQFESSLQVKWLLRVLFFSFHATHGTCEHELAAEQSCASSAAVRPLQSSTFCRFRYEKRLSLATKLLSWQQWGEPKPDGCCEWDACPNKPSESVFWFPKLKNPNTCPTNWCSNIDCSGREPWNYCLFQIFSFCVFTRQKLGL